jgi:small subunit ribosomal protein S5
MSNENTNVTDAAAKPGDAAQAPAQAAGQQPSAGAYAGKPGARRSDPSAAGKGGSGGKRFKKGGKRRQEGPQDEFEQRIIDIARVTRVMAGGKRMRFRACVAVGNRDGKIAVGLAKGADVTIAVTKAVTKAKKDILTVPLVNETIPHEIYWKSGAAKILFKPAKKGRGVIAGGAVRVILELAGVKNVTSKILGTNNKINNVKCTIDALKQLRKVTKKVVTEAPAAPAAEAVKEAKAE